jgi:hypothetical protein
MIDHLKNVRGCTVEETGHGIYNIVGDILPIQIIDNRQLSAEESLWLKNLSNRLRVTELSQMYVEITLEQVFEEVGWAAKWEARGETRGEARGEAKGMMNHQDRHLQIFQKLGAKGGQVLLIRTIIFMNKDMR